jgi:hypothetical protein
MRAREGRTVFGLAGIAVAATIALVAPAVAATEASWVDAEWASSAVGTSVFDCGTDTGYRTTATGQFLSGGVLGVDLDSVAGLAGVSATRDGSSSPVFSPAGATQVSGGASTDTYLNPLSIVALGSIGIDLSGFTLGLPLGSAGAVNQFAQVTNLGESAAASGLVTNDGGVGVTPSTPDNELPEPATIQLGTLLPAVADVTDVSLTIGAVAASSTLDWCAALESSIWGDGSVDGVDREYGIASLDLAVDSPLVAGLIPRVQTAITAVNAAVTNLQGTAGGVANSINGTLLGVGGVLAGLDLESSTGTITLTGLDLTAVTGLLSGPGAVLSDGVVTVDLTDPNGTILVDLGELLGGPDQLNNLSPNTELVINATVINDILTRAGNLVQGWVDDVTDALRAAVLAMQLHVDLTSTVGLKVLGADTSIIAVKTTLDASIGDLVAPTGTPPVVTVHATTLVTGLIVGTVNTLLGVLGLGTLATIVSGINSSVTLPGQLLSAITSAVSSNLVSIVDTLVIDLTAVVTQLVTALSTLLSPLPDVLSLMVNVQPDLPGAPPGVGFGAGTPPNESQEYRVTALRVGLVEIPGDAAVHLNLATASVGQNSLLP